MRIGNGYDIHRLGANRMLVLGGVQFPGEPGLIGHSDADPVMHALADAVLGAAALGDIGEHFPDTDPAWKGADSAGILAEALRLAAVERGLRPVNVDVNVIAERPRLAERVFMRALPGPSLLPCLFMLFPSWYSCGIFSICPGACQAIRLKGGLFFDKFPLPV